MALPKALLFIDIMDRKKNIPITRNSYLYLLKQKRQDVEKSCLLYIRSFKIILV